MDVVKLAGEMIRKPARREESRARVRFTASIATNFQLLPI
jgi:hypothetical protein